MQAGVWKSWIRGCVRHQLFERCCDAALRHGDNPLAVGSFMRCVERAERSGMTGKGRWAALWEAVSLEEECWVVVVVSWTERRKRNALEGFPGETRFRFVHLLTHISQIHCIFLLSSVSVH